jgi:elongation of very long chain fatty acids protein 6
MLELPSDNNIEHLYESAYYSAWPLSVTPIQQDVDSHTFSVLPFHFDKEFSRKSLGDWALYFRQTWTVPIVVSLSYGVFVYAGQKYMTKRNPFDLRIPLAVWNLLLAIFSILTTIKVVPYFLYTLFVSGPEYFLTRVPLMTHAQGGEVSFWCLAFLFSKYAELADTIFLVLRKKPVPLLHWYHHATVLLLSVQTLAVSGPTGIIMVSMNSIVHSFMYTYYFLAAVLSRPPGWGRLVTRLQILQMLLGSLMAVSMFIVPKFIPNAHGVFSNNVAIALVYLSYLVLFVQFYGRKYSTTKPKRV